MIMINDQDGNYQQQWDLKMSLHDSDANSAFKTLHHLKHPENKPDNQLMCVNKYFFNVDGRTFNKINKKARLIASNVTSFNLTVFLDANAFLPDCPRFNFTHMNNIYCKLVIYQRVTEKHRNWTRHQRWSADEIHVQKRHSWWESRKTNYLIVLFAINSHPWLMSSQKWANQINLAWKIPKISPDWRRLN